jgi:myo-inositol 2-dehydrogenase/D-chiro-inositol 1-dehydrogenase
MFRLGLIGAGFIGNVHARCVQREVRAKLVKIYDVNPMAAKGLAEAMDASVAISAEELLADNSIDAVIIASSTDTHGLIIRSAVMHKKPFLCEKPLDNTLRSARETAEKVLDRKILGCMAFNRRFDRQHALLQQAVCRGDIGSIEMMHLTSRSQSPPNFDYARKSGGLLRDKGAHFFDLACWIANDQPIKVYAEGACLFEPQLAEINDYDTAMIIVQFSRGGLCHFNFSRRTAYGYDERIEVFGSRGRIESGTPVPLEVVGYFGETITKHGLHQNWFERVKPTYSAQLSAFLDRLEGSPEEMPTVLDGLLAEVIADAAQQSINTGKAIYINELFENNENTYR